MHKSLDVVQPSDVIVVGAGGATTNAVLGDLITNKAVAGVIIDGLLRDLPEVKETGLPVYARGVTPIGRLHRGPGELNFPISCGGIVVNAGDIIVADRVGIVVGRPAGFRGGAAAAPVRSAGRAGSVRGDVRKGDLLQRMGRRALAEGGCRITS